MPTIAEALDIAIQHHQAGQLPQAEHIYRQILEVDPQHAHALHLLGVIAAQVAQFAIAAELIGNAIRLAPHIPVFHQNLGKAQKDQGQLDAAAASYRRALELAPDTIEVLKDLGQVLTQQCQWDAAQARYQRVLELQPDYVDVHCDLGTLHKFRGDFTKAVACYQRALALKPDCGLAYNGLGSVLQDQGRLDDALTCYRHAAELQPGLVGPHNNLGLVCYHLGRLDEALAASRRAVELEPNNAEANNTLAMVLHDQGDLEGAERTCRRALELKPGLAQAHNNLGTILKARGAVAESIVSYRRSIELQPDFADAHNNLGMACLLAGNLAEGWAEYEWRWKCPEWTLREFHRPAWNGESLAGKTILLHAEQGLGDMLQFVRFAALVKGLGARTIVECHEALVETIGHCAGVDQAVAPGWPLPDFDLQLPLMSVPRVLQTTLDTIPASVPYLYAEPAREQHWLDALSGVTGLRVGVSWQGRPTHRGDRQRSVPLRFFEPLARCANVSLVSLQKGAGTEQLADLARDHSAGFPILDLQAGVETISETAAVMTNLDLVITVDTAVAHLAGGLGLPVWVVLPFAPDWRWLRDRDDSPWYPTLRLFRQTRMGHWDDVQERLVRNLSATRLSDRPLSPER